MDRWSFDFDTFTVELDPSKLRRLLDLLKLLSDSPRCTISSLEKLTGELLWLSNLFQPYRASLAPLYMRTNTVRCRICVRFQPTSTRPSGLCPKTFALAPLPLAAIPVGCKLLRVAHTPITVLFREVLRMWLDCQFSTTFQVLASTPLFADFGWAW